MELTIKNLTGTLKDITPAIIREINDHLNRSRIKVGITHDVDKRKAEHDNSDKKWDEMIVLYKSSSWDNVRELEKKVIERFGEKLENEIGGGGGDKAKSTLCYLYVLLKKPKIVF